MSLAWWNGRLVPIEEVRIAPDDAGQALVKRQTPAVSIAFFPNHR